MSEDLTPRQQILLWDLVSRGGSALQMDIKPPVESGDRKRLEKAGLIVVSKTGRANRLTLSEEVSWARLGGNPPSLLRSGSGGSKYDRAILQFVLERIIQFAQANSVGISQIIAAQKIVSDEDGDDPQASRPPPSLKGIVSEETVRDEIEDAFFALAGRPAINQVRLRFLRERLAHIPRKTLDEALIAMREAGRASFSRLSNPPDIAAEGDAALSIRDQHFHTIWIEP